MTHPKVLALADQIANECNPTLHRASGDLQEVAIAAIERVTTLGAKFAGWAHMVPPDGGSRTDEETQLAAHIEASFTRFDHLPEPERGSDEPLP